jgi:CubicO group peptidase (beta-lactamase class C family)
MFVRIVGCCLVAAYAVLSWRPALSQDRAPAAESAEPLIGLWSAQRRFNAFTRATLEIRRSGSGYVADMLGHTLPVSVDGRVLSFALPNDLGAFRGTLSSHISGHWYPPNEKGMYAGGKHATPVRLQASAGDRWAGQVEPYDDVFTFWMLVQQRPDGTLHAVLRNVERDWGSWLGVERIARQGDKVDLFGKRPGDKEVGIVASGRYDAQVDTLTFNFPGRGGSYDFRRDTDASDFYPRGRKPARYAYAPPLERDDGWRTATLEDAGIDRAAMEKLVQSLIDLPMDSMAAPQVHGLLVARRDKLVLEEYFHGEHRDKLHESRSAGKTVSAIVVGAAIEAGAPLALSTPVYQVMNGGTFPAQLEPRKRAMTLEHLLTGASGFFCDDQDPQAPGNEETMLDQAEEPDFYRYTMRVPMAYEPGARTVYCSANSNLALGTVGRALRETPIATFDRLIGAPLGIERYTWLLDPAGNPYGGGSVQMLPRDFLKLGQLLLNGGTWRGQRILGSDYVKRATAPLYKLRGVCYGYAIWGIDYPYKDRKVYAYFAGGAGGQGVMVVPELDLVVAVFGGNYNSGRPVKLQQELVPNFILPAVREAGDDADAPVTEGTFATPYRRAPESGGPTGVLESNIRPDCAVPAPGSPAASPGR